MRLNEWLRLATRARITNELEAITMTMSVLLTASNGSSTRLAVAPSIQSRLKMLDPTTFPTAISIGRYRRRHKLRH